MGIICVPNCGLDNFHENMARLKYLVSGDGGFSRSHEVEQEYKSEESKCWKLRKIVEGTGNISCLFAFVVEWEWLTCRDSFVIWLCLLLITYQAVELDV